MISERTFARYFPGFWGELLPLLTPAFVHVIKESYERHVLGDFGFPADAVGKQSESGNSAVLAEFAYFLAKAAVENKCEVAETFQSEELRTSALQCAEAAVEKYEARGGSIPATVTLGDQQEALALGRNYELFFRQRSFDTENIELSVQIPGAGFLSPCQADLSIGSRVFEIKTVDRNIAGKDIRQLIVYLALQAGTGERRWNRAGFFNPRRAVYQEFDVDQVISRMSGGRSSAEVFRDLIDFVCSRDVQIDIAF